MIAIYISKHPAGQFILANSQSVGRFSAAQGLDVTPVTVAPRQSRRRRRLGVSAHKDDQGLEASMAVGPRVQEAAPLADSLAGMRPASGPGCRPGLGLDVGR